MRAIAMWAVGATVFLSCASSASADDYLDAVEGRSPSTPPAGSPADRSGDVQRILETVDAGSRLSRGFGRLADGASGGRFDADKFVVVTGADPAIGAKALNATPAEPPLAGVKRHRFTEFAKERVLLAKRRFRSTATEELIAPDPATRDSDAEALESDVRWIADLANSGVIPADTEVPFDDKSRATLVDRLRSASVVEAQRALAVARESAGGITVVGVRLPAFNLKKISDLGFTLRRAFGETAPKQFASLEQSTDFSEGHSELTFEGCLRWEPKSGSTILERGRWKLAPIVATDARLTLEDSDPKNFWALRVGAALRWDGSPEPWTTSNRLTRAATTFIVATYRESQDSKVRLGYLEASFNPVLGAIGLGVRRGQESIGVVNGVQVGYEPNGCCSDPGNFVSGQWNFVVRARAGERFEAGDGKDREDLIASGEATISGTLYFDAVGRALGAGWDSRLYPFLQLKYTILWKPMENDTSDDLYEAIVKIPLNSEVAIEATYQNGFVGAKGREIDKLAIGITFGF